MENWKEQEFISSSTKTDQFKKFAREFKKAINVQVKEEFDFVSYSVGHFYVSGFLKNKETGEFVYFSTSDVRHFNNEWFDHILVRTAKHEKDYTGGHNNYTSLPSFGEKIKRLVK